MVAAPERASRIRQRQRLIDACISALHIHGPSRTTVEKVVALADLSPGIVRFYFDSKDAMLLASLAHLAAEFEERVLVPVAQLKGSPVEALERLVELYLDPDIASPRKVSVWYSFWGEASSRQEYYDICGRKDEDFAALVRDLIGSVVALAGEAHLDVDAIALGLIGVLEVLWQRFAFQSEADIDREAARAQSLAFLRSVFPRQFAARGTSRVVASAVPGGTRQLPHWAYSDAVVLTAERERLFQPAWQVLGHEAEVPTGGDFLAGDLGSDRALVVRDDRGVLHAFRNACRRRPHALASARTGHFDGSIQCVPHGIAYSLAGKRLEGGGAAGDLVPLDLKQKSGLILVRAPGAAREGGPALTGWEGFSRFTALQEREVEVAADWKILVEQWLESTPVAGRFLAPNQLVQSGPAGAVILRVLPVAPGRSRLQRLDLGTPGGKRAKRELPGAAAELDKWIAQQVALAESTQTALAAAAADVAESGPVSAALAEFRGTIAVLLPHRADSRNEPG